MTLAIYLYTLLGLHIGCEQEEQHRVTCATAAAKGFGQGEFWVVFTVYGHSRPGLSSTERDQRRIFPADAVCAGSFCFLKPTVL